MSLLAWLAMAAAVVVAGLRWLRVAQREHYLEGSVLATLVRWLRARPLNAGLALLLPVGVVVAAVTRAWWVVIALAAVWAVLPWPLSWRGRSAPLRWTVRLRRLAGIVGAVLVPAVALFVILGGAEPWVAAIIPLLELAAFEIGLLLALPLERRLSQRFVDSATAALSEVAPRVVAITGSFGKTSTKEYLRHLLEGSQRVVATPASFNNRMGLARAVNEHLAPGTEVFIAEMGTYGPGEIADLCEWVTPEIAMITAIGPVHLERFGTVDRILEAKAEIFEKAKVAILNVDDERLAGLADALPIPVIRVSAGGRAADVVLRRDGEELVLDFEGVTVGRVEQPHAFASNAAAAAAAAREFGVAPQEILERLGGLPAPQHRQSTYVGDGGFTIIDDTFNSNPQGAAAALGRLEASARPGGRRVVVTPGMVELGPRQAEENRDFARRAASVADDLVIVGWTNRRDLLRGAEGGSASVIVMPAREDAVAWVRTRLQPGDAVLYENDLPDHYP